MPWITSISYFSRWSFNSNLIGSWWFVGEVRFLIAFINFRSFSNIYALFIKLLYKASLYKIGVSRKFSQVLCSKCLISSLVSLNKSLVSCCLYISTFDSTGYLYIGSCSVAIFVVFVCLDISSVSLFLLWLDRLFELTNVFN